jgi:hypothetical protein
MNAVLIMKGRAAQDRVLNVDPIADDADVIW